MPKRVHRETVVNQLANWYRRAITTGRMKPGTEMPSLRDLARQEDVSLSSVRRAYDLLHAEGLIRNRPGLPSVVAGPDDPPPIANPPPDPPATPESSDPPRPARYQSTPPETTATDTSEPPA